ncbi:helix-turn-helix transcriptional regulator [Eubacteriales bacterium OttesenSCG-928-M02]|nr:helix-turn-helix transcriptional regulator [Eubacteriales bacterium OttesenSCG-928-M02]
MYEWHAYIQRISDEIDTSIENREGEAVTLTALSRRLGYSPYHTTRKFREIAGISFREYFCKRKLAYALIQLRDTKRSILSIALDYGFSSHEAFTRAFKDSYGITPSAYRKNPMPLVLRTKINTFDRYILGLGEIGMVKATNEVKVYFVSIPHHKFLHIKNYESNGYFDFWEKQENIPGKDCDTICGILDSIKGKLDGEDGVIGQFSGQIMGYLYEADGRVPEAYGVRLTADYDGPIPPGMLLLDVPEGEYIVFEHGAFDYDSQSETVDEAVRKAVEAFDYEETDYAADHTAGRVGYFQHDPARFHKLIYPVRKR